MKDLFLLITWGQLPCDTSTNYKDVSFITYANTIEHTTRITSLEQYKGHKRR